MYQAIHLKSETVYCFFSRLAVICCFLSFFSAWGQDTVSLKAVEISATKLNLMELGKKTERIDSALKQQFILQAISDLLNLNSTLFIKSYGPGGIASSTFRGGNASQTAILWNGLNIQNTMLGQSDLSLIPNSFFDEVQIEYGGSSSAWGSGAVAGAVHLNNRTSFNNGTFAALSLGGASFGRENACAKVSISKSRFVSSTQIYQLFSANTYSYLDTLDKENPMKKMSHASYSNIGLMQELRWSINPRQIISVNAWLTENKRSIPTFVSNTNPKTYQKDEAIRLSANWSYEKQKFTSLIKAAWLSDQINYDDSLADIYSKSNVKTIIAENENFYKWHKNQQLYFGLNFTSSSAISNNYESQKEIHKYSVVIGNKSSFLKKRLQSYIGVRAEYFSVGKLPITWNVSLTYHLSEALNVLANLSTVYRQPTLNELYWVPGGNNKLNPEQGNAHDLGINFRKKISKFEFTASFTIYQRQINDWILWVPGDGGQAMAQNIQKVWSRGSESSLKIIYRNGPWLVSFSSLSGYVLSTSEETKLSNSASLNKQLIYTPRYTVNGNMVFGYNNIQVYFFQQYIGYRFTSSDNSQWLNPYNLSSLRVNFSLTKEKIHSIFFVGVNNIFSENYQIIKGRPMPLRNYEVGLTLQFKNNNKLK